MLVYIKTVSFESSGNFNAKKDDRKVNNVLDRLRAAGGDIKGVTVALGGKLFSANATYLIIYEASAPVELK